MIEHIVMLRLRSDADPDELRDVVQGLDGLRNRLSGFEAFHHGPNRDFEAKSAQWPYGFTARFADADAVRRYAEDDDHKALGARLVALCEGGAEGIVVFDLDVT